LATILLLGFALNEISFIFDCSLNAIMYSGYYRMCTLLYKRALDEANVRLSESLVVEKRALEKTKSEKLSTDELE